jgi:hypothetical protein
MTRASALKQNIGIEPGHVWAMQTHYYNILKCNVYTIVVARNFSFWKRKL